MSDAPLVPEPPPEKVIIPAEDTARLEKWIGFFQRTFPRVKVLLPKEDEFEGFLERAAKTLRKERTIEDHYELVGFPTEEWTAFVIQIDESEPGSIFATYEWRDTYFFCFGDAAFSLGHFHWDGDAEAGDWATSYSLSTYSKSCLQWNFIKTIIVNSIKRLEKRVPPLEG